MPSHRRWSLALAGALWLALTPQVHADAASETSPGANPNAPAPAEAQPETIPAPEIASRAETAKSLIQQVGEQALEDPVRKEIEDKLPEMAAKLRERRTRADELTGGLATPAGLNEVDNEWRARATRLADWRLALTHTAQILEAQRADLTEERELWERTRAAATSGALPQETISRVDETVAGLRAGEAKLRARIASILVLQNQVAEEETIVDDVLDRVAKRRADLNKVLWTRDSPPLWSAAAWVAPKGVPTLSDGIREAVGRRVELLLEFSGPAIQRIEAQVAVFVAVLLAIVAARRRVRAAAAAQVDAALTVPTRVVDRPISAAIVVALLSVYWFLPRAPGLLAEIQGVVLLVPVVRLLPEELFTALRPGLVTLAVLFVAGSVRGMFGAVPRAERLMMLLETGGMFALLVWLQRPALANRLRSIGRLGTAVLPLARLALLVTVASLAANVLGLVQLARLLLRTVLISLYAAVAIYALTRFAGGVVTAIVRSDAARRLRSLRDHGELVRRRTLNALQWFAAFSWVVSVLRVLGVEDAVRNALTSAFAARLEVGTVSVSLGNLVAFVLCLWLANQVSRFVRFVVEEDVMPRVALPRGVPAAISTGLHYAIFGSGVLIAIGAAGVDLSKFSLLAGALGVGIGFGLQNVVNNFVSGLILLFERPVQTGDQIQVGDVAGEVKRIGIRSSTVRTGEGADVIVPNATLISDRVVNWTFSDRLRRVDLAVRVGYGSDAVKVLALLLETARANPDVLSLPEPAALFSGFADSSLSFQLQVWCRIELGGAVRSALGVALLGALRSAGIEIPFPQQDVHLKVDSGGRSV